MRLSHLTIATLLLSWAVLGAVVWVGKHPLVIPRDDPGKHWKQCVKPADELMREVCANLR